jgi:hypothetical protein
MSTDVTSPDPYPVVALVSDVPVPTIVSGGTDPEPEPVVAPDEA